MATTETAGRRDRAVVERTGTVVKREETKVSFLTTEFWAMAASIAAILFAANQAENFGAERAWTLVAAVVVGYMVSRGLAKSGSAHRDRDDVDRS
jgi:hypothetical protein